ncbi:aldehyde dehydrogenase family protein [Sphingobacterium daejeonense]|uniref:aldehyde dehydrogenase family protein n=1 Tax=Sphingobacterium daejeonense TaxID=371142 RepID=UPI0010C45DEE|nr:aldehyde dehydrogenase family protein [Sphingobacterium daejeonense]VTP91237.1 Succinate-semialdehyde dehydrogenase [NADP(+)] GabD [Sphingobacterium daejeonense]
MKNSLLIEKAYLNGAFISSKKTFEVINPSTLKPVGSLPDLTVKDCQKFIDTAHKSWEVWKSTPVGERSKMLRNLYNLINEHKQELAENYDLREW